MWIVMIKSLRYYIKSLCIKKCHTLMKFRIPIIYLHSKVRTNQRPRDTCTAEPILIVWYVTNFIFVAIFDFVAENYL